MHRRFEDSAVTEDDINEVKSDISAMRYEMLEVFEKNGMDISSADKKEKAHLAKRMKVWERRLMKDFHVTAIPGEEEEEPPEEKGIARFRRIAQQVAHQTSSHKWNEAVSGVTHTQIGRCRNRESFRNQQNLQRAMEEAKRLVSRSPAASRTCTPVEFYDPTTNTLLELLKNITEEAGELSPQSTVRTAGDNDRSTQLTQQLHELFGNKSPSPLPPNVLQKLEAVSVAHAKDVNGTQRKSISSVLSQQSNDEVDKKVRSTSPSIASTRSSKSPEPAKRKSISSNASQPSSGEELNTCMQYPPPLIQITRTESGKLSELSKPLKSKASHDEIPKSNTMTPTNVESIKPALANTDPTKNVKRKAPAPSTSAEPATDIAISRPVPLKIDPKQGMIPPPPINEKKDTTTSNSTETSFTTQPRRTSLTPRPVSPVPPSAMHSKKQPPAPIPTQQTNLRLPILNITTVTIPHESVADSSENLLQTKEPSANSSPVATLRPTRKVDEVTTIKRQPKTGWL